LPSFDLGDAAIVGSDTFDQASALGRIRGK
jgi:hypothetical protein